MALLGLMLTSAFDPNSYLNREGASSSVPWSNPQSSFLGLPPENGLFLYSTLPYQVSHNCSQSTSLRASVAAVPSAKSVRAAWLNPTLCSILMRWFLIPTPQKGTVSCASHLSWKPSYLWEKCIRKRVNLHLGWILLLENLKPMSEMDVAAHKPQKNKSGPMRALPSYRGLGSSAASQRALMGSTNPKAIPLSSNQSQCCSHAGVVLPIAVPQGSIAPAFGVAPVSLGPLPLVTQLVGSIKTF